MATETTYDHRLFRYLSADRARMLELVFADFEKLQRLNISHLQNELARIAGAVAGAMTASDKGMKKIETTLEKYTTAIRIYEYFKRLAKATGSQAKEKRIFHAQGFLEIGGLPAEPYTSDFRPFPDSSFFNHKSFARLFKRGAASKCNVHKQRADYSQRRVHAQRYTGRGVPFRGKTSQIHVAFTGGVSLIAPMVVMRTYKTLVKSLVTVSVSVVLFADMLSLVFQASNTETSVATATHAAVLVFFVGTSEGSS